MLKSLDLYLIATRRGRDIAFSPSDVVEACESASNDGIRRAIRWIGARPYRLVAWSGRVLEFAHNYYVRLEDRIDPMERVLKSLGHADGLTIHYSPATTETAAGLRFRRLLRHQRYKHLLWGTVDGVAAVVLLGLTPLLVPIPGPNVFLYYPALRLWSHYRAYTGATAAGRFSRLEFKSLPELSGLEDNLHARRLDRTRIRAIAEHLKVQGLGQFLERMV